MNYYQREGLKRLGITAKKYYPEHSDKEVPCEECNGTGRDPEDKRRRCYFCDATGKEPAGYKHVWGTEFVKDGRVLFVIESHRNSWGGHEGDYNGYVIKWFRGGDVIAGPFRLQRLAIAHAFGMRQVLNKLDRVA